jgi:hypothetical protein
MLFFFGCDYLSHKVSLFLYVKKGNNVPIIFQHMHKHLDKLHNIDH